MAPRTSRSTSRSRSVAAGIRFPVGRVSRLLKKYYFQERVSKATPVFIAAALEFVTLDLERRAMAVAQGKKKVSVTNKHVLHAARTHPHMLRALGHFLTPSSEVVVGLLPGDTKPPRKLKKDRKRSRAASAGASAAAAEN